MLLANGLAQAQALMLGRSSDEALAEQPQAPAGAAIDAATLAAHRTFPGNRPSTTFAAGALTPRSLGALLALYEHRVFTSGAVWGIDSFDQWGVELGKVLGNRLLPLLDGAAGQGRNGTAALDPSTLGLLARLGGPPVGAGMTSRWRRFLDHALPRTRPKDAQARLVSASWRRGPPSSARRRSSRPPLPRC